MVGIKSLIFGVIGLQLVSASAVAEDWPVALLKRQEPGTNAYNCHDNCGQAIIGFRSTGYCTNPAFLSNYANCLICSGPDNVNIWIMYGTTLTRAATSCGGLSTTPLSGKQPDVPTATPAAGGSVTPSSSSSSSVANSTPTPSSSVSVSTAPPSSATSSTTRTTSASSTPSAASSSVASSTSSAASTAISAASSTIASTRSTSAKPTTASSTVSGAAQGTGSATTSSSLGTFTGAAGSTFPDSMAVIAAVAMIGAAMV
ncbi:hypothetical protein BGZ60DRAFT_274416 [Tricladium varicosporioides]|nr:hypothetical protein BGZ60DRAFT_274416 [Hymenoscyphus varicosporioides]